MFVRSTKREILKVSQVIEFITGFPGLFLYVFWVNKAFFKFQGSIRHVQKGHPTFVTQVADSPKLMRI